MYQFSPKRIERMPTAAEEPDSEARYRLATRIPPECIERMPTATEEPDAMVRYCLAGRISPKCIERIPTDEPDADVRRVLERRRSKAVQP